MKKSFLIIGLGNFGRNLGIELTNMGAEVMGIDKNEAIVQDASDMFAHALTADCTDESVLRSLGVRNFDTVIVSVGDAQASTMISMLLKELGVENVMSKALNDIHGRLLEKIGVDTIVHPERDMAIRMAQKLTREHIFDYIDLSKDYGIAEVVAPASWVGKSIGDLDVRRKYHLNIVAINSNEEINVAPNADATVKEHDIIAVLGRYEDIERIK